MKRILCPIDFSDTSLNALEYAAQIGSFFQSTLTLLYVYNEEEFLESFADVDSLNDEDGPTQARRKLRAMVHELHEQRDDLPHLQVEYMLRIGDLVDTVLNQANKEQSQLIIMGTTGAGNLNKTFMGSNTVQVFRNAPCPVLCVPTQAQFSAFEHFAFASDYGQEDQRLLQEFIAFAAQFSARVEVLHASTTESKGVRARFEEFEQEMRSYSNYSRLSFKMLTDPEQDPAHILDEYMAQAGVQILGLLTHERNFFGKLLHHSVSRELAYFSTFPLLVYRI